MKYTEIQLNFKKVFRGIEIWKNPKLNNNMTVLKSFLSTSSGNIEYIN